MTASDEVGGIPIFGVCVSIKNPSPNTIHLASVSILYRHARPRLMDYVMHVVRFRRIPRTLGWVHTTLSDYGVNTECPCEISPGSAHNILIPEEVLHQMLAETESDEIRGLAQDQLWRNKYTRPFSVPSSRVLAERV